MQHLQRRGLRLYFRLAIPRELQEFFDGRRELRRSLGTVCYDEGVGLARLEVGRASRLFMQIRGGVMTRKEIQRLVSAYFERNLEDAEDRRADGLGLLEDSEDGAEGESGLEGLELYLEGLKEDLARGELRSISRVADAILKEAGIELDKGSHDYRVLSREALKGAVEAIKTELAQRKGDYSDEFRPRLTPSPVPTVDQGDFFCV